MSEKGSNSDSLEELNTNNNNNSVVATEEIEEEEREKREAAEKNLREAIELLKKNALYFSTNQIWQEIGNYKYKAERNASTVCVSRQISFCLNTLIDYITSPKNHFRKSSFKDFFDLKACDSSAHRLPYKPFLPELPKYKTPMNATLIDRISFNSVASRIANMIKVPQDASEDQKCKILKIKQKVWRLVDYFELANTKISPRLYRRILRNYPNATHEQILIASVIYSYFPWYNSGSVFTYFSKEDLDKIYKILSYSFLINDSAKKEAFLRYSCRNYLYNNRKDKSFDKFEKFKNAFAGKFDEIGLKPENFSIMNLNKFSKAEQEFITTRLKFLDFMEIIMEGNVASVNVVKNLYAYCKIYDENPIEVIKNMKLDYKENHNGAELSNSDLHALLNVDAIESLNKFENIINPEFLTVKRIQQISKNEKLKEIIVASLINNSFNSFVYNGANYFPPNYLSQNPKFSLIFLIHGFFLVPYHENVTVESQSKIMNYVINNFNSIHLFFKSKKEASFDNRMEYFVENFSVEEAAVAEQFYTGFNLFNVNFSNNLTLTAISILENPSNITSFTDKFHSNNSKFFINQFAICINVNEAYREKFIEALANINLNLVPNIFKNSNIAKLYKKEGSNENLKQKVIDKKRESLPEGFDNENLSDDLLFYLPKSTFEQEKLAKLKDLNDIIFELPDGVIDWAVSAKPDEIPVIKNIATAQSINDIEKNTIQVLIKQKDYLYHPIFSFFVQKLLNKIPFNEVKDEDNKVLNLALLNRTIIDYASSRAGEGGLSTQEMNNLNFTLSQICDVSLRNYIVCMRGKNILPQLQAEKETRDNEKNFIITQISKMPTEKETRKENLYTLCNGLILNNLDDIYYLNRLPSILREVSQSFNEQETRSILLEASDPNYIMTLVNEANNNILNNEHKHPIELARSYSPQLSNPER